MLGAQVRQFLTVRRTIEMATFAPDTHTGKQKFDWSPDARHFFVVTRRGVLSSDQLESTIWLFDSEVVKSFIMGPSNVGCCSPKPLVTMAATKGDAITSAHWARDGRTIAFLGRKNGSERHLFVVGIRDGGLRQITPTGQDVTDFDEVRGTFVYTFALPIDGSALYQASGAELPDIQVGAGPSLFGFIFPNWERFEFGLQAQQIAQARNGKLSSVLRMATHVPISLTKTPLMSLVSLSPSGRYVVTTSLVQRVPASWEAYEPAFVGGPKIIANDSSIKLSYMTPGQYMFVDLQARTVRRLDAPLGLSAGYFAPVKAAWSPDERKVILSNTFLPFDQGNRLLSDSRRPCVAVVTIATLEAECIKEIFPADPNRASTTDSPADIDWRARDQVALRFVDSEGKQLVQRFQYGNDGWKLTQKTRSDRGGKIFPTGQIILAVRQSLNKPPVMVATDAAKGEPRTIWDPNPQLRGIELGEVSIFRWQDKAGHEWTGGLTKPPDYVSGHRYPLVIQTHGFNPEEFLTDGSFATANAARPLAAEGIIVLQVAEITAAPRKSPQEAEVDGRAGYVSAVDHLAADGLIDSRRVGIIGFSRTGWYVLDSLIHAPKYFAAATLAESTYESFGEYLMNSDYISPEAAKGIVDGIGSEPFGEGLKSWFTASPGFNTDKICAPILFEQNNPVAMIYGWDVYAALRLQRKPVELLYMRSGSHVLTQPSERLMSQEMSVDWYDFWLNDHEDPAPGKADQYGRWRALRNLNNKICGALSLRTQEGSFDGIPLPGPQ